MTNKCKMTRREFFKASGVMAGSFALGGYISPARSDDRVLNWLTYAGHSDAFVVEPFERAHGVQVQGREYTGGERMLSLIHGSPRGAFDVVTSDAPYVAMLREADLIEPLDAGDYDFDDFWEDFHDWPQHWFDGELFAILTSWGFNGLAYNSDVLSAEDVRSYDIMWDERMKGRVGMREWYLPVMGCLSLHLGHERPYDITDEQFENLKESMFSLRPQVQGFWGFGGTFDSLAGGVIDVIPGTGDWMTGMLRRDGHPIMSATTDEGAVMWTESASIVRGTGKRELAQEFIRYLTSPEGQRRLMLKDSYMASGPNRTAWEELNRDEPEIAGWLNMDLDGENLMDMLRDGRIVPRGLPTQQSMEDWADSYSEFQAM